MDQRKLSRLGASLALALAAGSLTTTATAGGWPGPMVHLHGSGNAFLVDPATEQIASNLDTCKGGTLASSTRGGKKVSVSCAAGGEMEIVVIDLDNRAVSKRIVTGNRPKDGVVGPDGKWVGIIFSGLDDGRLRVTFLDAVTDEIVKVVDLPVGAEPKGVTSMKKVGATTPADSSTWTVWTRSARWSIRRTGAFGRFL